MKIIIQNTNEAFRIRERGTLKDYVKNHLGKDENGAVILAAEVFLENFPRFKEIILNTELTEDVSSIRERGKS